jgi:hypothetical protein
MADNYNEEVIEDAPSPSTAASAAAPADVEMAEGSGEGASGAASGAGASENPNSSELPFAEGGPDDDAPPPRITFVQYLSSPIVTLLVGSGDKETILTAHQGLLTQSPYFAEACAEFADDGSVCLSCSGNCWGIQLTFVTTAPPD